MHAYTESLWARSSCTSTRAATAPWTNWSPPRGSPRSRSGTVSYFLLFVCIDACGIRLYPAVCLYLYCVLRVVLGYILLYCCVCGLSVLMRVVLGCILLFVCISGYWCEWYEAVIPWTAVRSTFLNLLDQLNWLTHSTNSLRCGPAVHNTHNTS